MAGVSILQEVELGILNFEEAFLKITRSGQNLVSLQIREPEVDRNEAGQVVLVPTAEAFNESANLHHQSSTSLLTINDVMFKGDTLVEVGVSPVRLKEAGEDNSFSSHRRNVADVVTLRSHSESVAVVTLRDEENRNMFSRELMQGVLDVFSRIKDDPLIKVVVIEGYGNWFCSGGTPETLEEIRVGGASFMDSPFFKALLDCSVPTIAALGGHALGGGLTFGLYADLIVMSETSYYAANFMEHGFTPGVGATYLFPLRFGLVLGNEMMWTARRYKGRELRERGAPMEILPKDAVARRALELAEQIATKPSLQLKRLKAHLSQQMNEDLPGVFEREQTMHDTVFAQHRHDVEKEK